jgi:hypothetical protein
MYAFPLKRENLENYAFQARALELLTEASPDVQRAQNQVPDYERIEIALRDLEPERGHIVEVGAYSGLLLKSFTRERNKIIARLLN